MAKRSSNLPPDLQEVGSILGQLQNESDRGAALIGAALVDDSLSHYIRAKFIDDEKSVDELIIGDVPLGTFSAKIKLVYCMGWIGANLRADLDRVRSIRNDFAHNRSGLTFETNSIKDRCSQLYTIRVHNQFSVSAVVTAREAFSYACTFISGYFISLTDRSTQPKTSPGNAHDLYVKRVTEQIDQMTITTLLDRLEASEND